LIKKDINLNVSILSKHALKLTFIIISLFAISACSGILSDKKIAPTLFNNFSETSEYLLTQASEASELESTDWELAAVQSYLIVNKYKQAEAVIGHLQNKTLTATQSNDLLLLIAERQHGEAEFEASLTTIESIDTDLLSVPANLYYLKLKTNLLIRKQDHQGASDTLLILTPLLEKKEDKQKYNDMLLAQLSLLPLDVLNKFQIAGSESEPETAISVSNQDAQALETELAKIAAEIETKEQPKKTLTEDEIFVQGWYDLASVYKRYQSRSNQLLQGLEAWEFIYPTHPVLDMMPTQLKNIPEATPYSPTKVAILLPLSGRFQKPAEALQYGINYAFYEKNNANNTEQTLSERQPISGGGISISESRRSQIVVAEDKPIGIDPTLLFFDTNKMNMQEIADQLHQQKIDFVIGPLLKPNLEMFLPLVEDIPVLALNSFPDAEVDDANAPPTLTGSSLHYAFPLSPESEAEQAAELIFKNKHKKPLILAPNSEFGKRVSAAFEARWDTLHRSQSATTSIKTYPAESHFFGDKSKMDDFIGKALQVKASEQRISQMRSVLGRRIEADVRSRRDVDAIYIISKRSELILIKPFIDVTISPFAKTIPLYGSSRSHAADLTNFQNKELTGLTYSDIAFLMEDKKEINEEIQAIWPGQRFSNLRLFALGFDSYNLIGQLKQLEVIDNYHFQGLVGELTLDYSNTINSKLHWATYQDGESVEITTPTTSQ